MVGLESALAEFLARFGVRGVSISVVLVLLAIALYSHKAKTVGGVVGTGLHDAKVVALVLAVLAVAGVIQFVPDQITHYVDLAKGVDWLALLRGLI